MVMLHVVRLIHVAHVRFVHAQIAFLVFKDGEMCYVKGFITSEMHLLTCEL